MGCTTPAEAALALLLFPPRFVIMFAAELLAFTACIIAGFGAELPLAPWRRALVQAVVPACSRVVLATVGTAQCTEITGFFSGSLKGHRCYEHARN